jgi:hypothetical protein
MTGLSPWMGAAAHNETIITRKESVRSVVSGQRLELVLATARGGPGFCVGPETPHRAEPHTEAGRSCRSDESGQLSLWWLKLTLQPAAAVGEGA